MKAFIALSIALAFCITTTYGQCDKKSVVKASKTEYLAADSTVQRSVDETSTIEFDKTSMTVSIVGEQSQEMTGTIKEAKCDWATAYKDGKTVMKVDLVDGGGQTHPLTITIEGKNGKISFLVLMEEQQDMRIRLIVDKFEEKK